MEALIGRPAFLSALRDGSRIALSAYLMNPRSAVARALERAAGRGAQVSVTLEGSPYGDPSRRPLAAANAQTARELRRHGVHVHVTRSTEASFHMKAAVVDGTAYLDDRNWPARGPDTLLATSARGDVRAVSSALRGRPLSNGRLATEKAAALAREADTIARAAGDRIDVETESFGASAVSKALLERASHGTQVRLIVAEREYARAPRERATLARLAAAGVEVRVSPGDEKLCVGSDRAWVGSANATFAGGSRATIDWGMQISAAPLVSKLETAFEGNWEAAHSPVQ